MTEETTVQATAEAPAENKGPAPEKKQERSDDRGPRVRSRRPRQRKKREPKEFEEAILSISRVTRVVKGGRRMRFKVSVVIGDKKGRVAMGTGKSNEVMIGIQKAVSQAKKRMMNVPIVNGSIPHAVVAKFKASKVLLFPAPEGKGVIAGGAVRKILELAGYRDVLSKAHGSRNSLNLAKATLEALAELQKVKIVEKKADPKADKKEEAKKPAAKKAAPKKEKAPAKKAPAAKKEENTKK